MKAVSSEIKVHRALAEISCFINFRCADHLSQTRILLECQQQSSVELINDQYRLIATIGCYKEGLNIIVQKGSMTRAKGRTVKQSKKCKNFDSLISLPFAEKNMENPKS